MAAAAYDIVTGLNGERSIWPKAAISRDSNGVFRDIRGRRVAAAAFDSADDGVVVRRPTKANDADESIATKVARKLLPKALAMVLAEESEGEGSDDAESENADLFDEPVEPSIDDAADPQAVVSSVFANDFYKQERERWAGINRNNADNRGRAYAPVAANASKGH